MSLEDLLPKSDDWLKYAIRHELLGDTNDLELLKVQTLNSKIVESYLKDIVDFHDEKVSNHKNPGLPINKLLFLLDIGLDRTVPEIDKAIVQILEHKDENGIYQSLTNVPKHFGGSGEDVFAWSLCDAPSLLTALIMAGVDYEKHIKAGVEYLMTLQRENGFPCSVSSELGKFRGPGKKDDCCPYATLVMLKLLSIVPEHKNGIAVRISSESLLSLWEDSMLKHPYLFYMGNDFRKLKAPSIWYDIVSVTDVLSRFDYARDDPRFKEMVSIIAGKMDQEGMFTPESIYQKCKDWDFGQKKKPSPYLTFLCLRILKRLV